MMFQNNEIIRELYTSDVVLMEKEFEMMYGVDDSYFDKMEELYANLKDDQITLSRDELKNLENKFNDFYFEYGYVQFKRGLELGLSMRQIH